MVIRTQSSRSRAKKEPTFSVLLLLFSCGLSLLLAFRPFQSARENEVQAAINQEPSTVRIPVPQNFVPAGTRVQDIEFTQIEIPSESINEGYVRSVDVLGNSIALGPLAAYQPLFKENFSGSARAINPVLQGIPAGMRAMTIRVDATSSVEGWAGSGSVVDVLLIEQDLSSVIAEKVRILSAERSVAPVEGSASPSVPSTITLLVTQEQCLAINTAIPLGKIAFALRSQGDEEIWRGKSFSAQQLKNAPIESRPREAISGYVSVRDRENSQSFALSNGRWIKTDVLPQGFLVAQSNAVPLVSGKKQ